jgi:hypothetical protein
MRYLFIFLFLSFSGIGISQTVKSKDQSLQLSYSQIKESMNFGFVFRGPQLQYGRDWIWQKSDKRVELETQLGLSALFNKGIGLGFHLTPLNFNYLYQLNEQLWLGPGILTDYNYEFYPDIQMAHPFWFSHYSAGVSVYFQKKLQKRSLSVRFTSSLFGLTSRTQKDFNTLFFHPGFIYAIQDLHRNMSFNLVSQYNVSHLEIDLRPFATHRVRVSYFIDYSRYDQSPRWISLNYGIKLTIQPKQV